MKYIYIYVLILFTSIFALNVQNNYLMQDELYITGDDGVIRMYVNVIGHVKNPGTYLVYDSIDLMSVLSRSGGYLPGTNLSKIIIYSENGEKQDLDLKKMLNSKIPISEVVKLKPRDTIYLEQKSLHRFFVSSNLPSMILSFVTLAITLEDKND
tara:strand:+ start:639 stop:1100 length:462 start_codon:yes stop_codon:yes gene_type:complete